MSLYIKLKRQVNEIELNKCNIFVFLSGPIPTTT